MKDRKPTWTVSQIKVYYSTKSRLNAIKEELKVIRQCPISYDDVVVYLLDK